MNTGGIGNFWLTLLGLVLLTWGLINASATIIDARRGHETDMFATLLFIAFPIGAGMAILISVFFAVFFTP